MSARELTLLLLAAGVGLSGLAFSAGGLLLWHVGSSWLLFVVSGWLTQRARLGEMEKKWKG